MLLILKVVSLLLVHRTECGTKQELIKQTVIHGLNKKKQLQLLYMNFRHSWTLKSISLKSVHFWRSKGEIENAESSLPIILFAVGDKFVGCYLFYPCVFAHSYLLLQFKLLECGNLSANFGVSVTILHMERLHLQVWKASWGWQVACIAFWNSMPVATEEISAPNLA